MKCEVIKKKKTTRKFVVYLFVPYVFLLQTEAVNFLADLHEISLHESFTPASQA